MADVRVDPETGKVDVLRFTAIQDAGKAIHPTYVEGQMQGGAVQGIGWALNEEYIYDAKGVMQNAGFLDYRMPVASDLPMIDTQIIEVAESERIRMACAASARCRSSRRSRPSRTPCARRRACAFHDLPLSPPRVLAALEAAKG